METDIISHDRNTGWKAECLNCKKPLHQVDRFDERIWVHENRLVDCSIPQPQATPISRFYDRQAGPWKSQKSGIVHKTE